MHCNILQHTATHCNTLQHTANNYNNYRHLQYTRHTRMHCNTLQHIATHSNTPNAISCWVWLFPLKMPITHQIDKLGFLGISRYKFKLRFQLNLNLYQEDWVSRFGGFRGWSIFSGMFRSQIDNAPGCCTLQRRLKLKLQRTATYTATRTATHQTQ